MEYFKNSYILLGFYPFLKRLNMSSLIANKVKTKQCLVSIKLFIVHTILCTTVQTYTTITTRVIVCSFSSLITTFLSATTLIRYSSSTTIRYSAHTLRNTNTCALDLQTTTVLFTRNASSH